LFTHESQTEEEDQTDDRMAGSGKSLNLGFLSVSRLLFAQHLPSSYLDCLIRRRYLKRKEIAYLTAEEYLEQEANIV